jgi:hypothetical protein
MWVILVVYTGAIVALEISVILHITGCIDVKKFIYGTDVDLDVYTRVYN